MVIDYWQQFLSTGSIQDYLNYKNSLIPESKDKNGKSIDKDKRDSDKRSQNTGK